MRILLIGAGFTRNWGGWLASEFVGELCGRLSDRPHLNEMLRVNGNFEQTYGHRVTVAAHEPQNQQAHDDVSRMQRAIRDIFHEMNSAIASRSLNFSQDGRRSIKRFLSRFDAIFSLNQDLFFELHYDGMELESDGRWHGYLFPGIRISHEWLTALHKVDRIRMDLEISDAISVQADRIQPIYKLHGSANWRRADGSQLLVIGTGKEDEIARNKTLSRYQQTFREHVCKGGTRIMVIGYGFADPHINTVLLEGARQHSARMYLVNPTGSESFRAHPGVSGNGRNELYEIPLEGMSQRQLTEIFSDEDNPAFRSFERFFGTSRYGFRG